MDLAKIAVTPLSFPDLSLLVPYEQALRYTRFRLQMIGRGDLRPFCSQHQLPYTSVVGLKNNSLKREEPRLAQRVLRSLGVETTLVGYPPGANKQQFLFPTSEALATFHHQLQSFTNDSLLS